MISATELLSAYRTQRQGLRGVLTDYDPHERSQSASKTFDTTRDAWHHYADVVEDKTRSYAAVALALKKMSELTDDFPGISATSFTKGYRLCRDWRFVSEKEGEGQKVQTIDDHGVDNWWTHQRQVSEARDLGQSAYNKTAESHKLSGRALTANTVEDRAKLNQEAASASSEAWELDKRAGKLWQTALSGLEAVEATLIGYAHLPSWRIPSAPSVDATVKEEEWGTFIDAHQTETNQLAGPLIDLT